MVKLPSYEDLLQKIGQLEKQLSEVITDRKSIPENIDPHLFYKISEYSKNAIALFETKDNANSFTIKYFNIKAQEIENVDREKITGTNLVDSFPSMVNSGFLEALRRVFHSGISEEFPSTIIQQGKIIEWKQNFIYKLSDNELVCIFIDELDKKNKESELKLSKEILNFAMKAANYYPFEIYLDSNKITTNHELYASLGYSDKEIQTLLEKTGSLIHPEDYDYFKKYFQSAIKKENLEFKSEFRIKSQNGSWEWFTAQGKNIEWDHNKKPLRIVGLLKNIQEEKAIISKIQESEENFSQLADNINDAFWLRSIDHKVIYANPSCFNIVGKNFNAVFENFSAYKEWIHPEDRERIVKQREKNSKKPEKVHYYEHRIIKPDGKVRWLWIRTFPVFNSNGELYRRAGIASDITEQKKLLSDLLIAKEKAEESDKLKSAFLANMSHEIRTPMNGILGFAELLKDEYLSEKDRTKYLNIINNNSKQLLCLINDIIDIAKIEAGQIQINKTFAEINPFLEDVYQLFIEEQKRLKKQNINFNLNISATNNNIIFTDITRLHQIFSNLLSNAFKFTESGSIQFGYKIIHKNGSDYYQFFVSDTGIGIDETMQEFIFDRFVQAQTNNFRNQQGTGLGLAISKGLITLLNGKIWIESTPVNSSEGISGSTTFYFTIPVNNTAVSKTDIKSNIKIDINTMKNVSILVVEDDEDSLELLCRLLLKFGANPIVARTGEDAIKIIKSNNKIKIVLMDIRLPDMDGFETTKEIKKLNPDLPVIAQTAYAMYNDKEVCLQNGCDDYISKPINKDVLFHKINQYIYN